MTTGRTDSREAPGAGRGNGDRSPDPDRRGDAVVSDRTSTLLRAGVAGTRRWLGRLAVRVPGLYPRAPRRNTLVVLVYLSVALVVLGALFGAPPG